LPIIIEKHGDIMKDAVEFYGTISSEKSSIIERLKLHKNEFVLATIHREENTNDAEKLKAIFRALEEIHQQKKVVLPLHPRTKKILEENNLQYAITFIHPVGYFDMLELLKNCAMVFTDSGGLQKEAFFNKKHCVILREETEWIELVANGFAKIAGSNPTKIKSAFDTFLISTLAFDKELYGTNVGEKIYESILKLL
ncbi:MAG: UDP-N-acetylglucosamine 2-epimerase, partial [Polaribacter sp.]